MKKVRRLVLVLALSAVAVGCGGSVEQPQTQASAGTKAPIAPNTHGVVKVFGAALGEVALRPDQRAELEKLAIAADARHASMGEGKKDLMLALADQIEKGTIDKTALQSKIDRIAADLERTRPEDGAALARVHAILDPEQRNAFVDALEQRFKDKHHRGGKAKHEDRERGEAGEHGEHAVGAPRGKMGGMHAMKQLAEDLKLTDEQRIRIMEAMKGGREGHSFQKAHERMGHGKQVLEAFRSDKFDASAAAPADSIRVQAAEGSNRMIGVVEKVLPILTPEQRKIAAEKVRELANAGADMPFAH